MHDAVRIFLDDIKKKHPEYFDGKRVLEMGSMNFNGSVRDYFTNCDYTGIDWKDGAGVDKVVLAHKFDAEPFDVVITTEMLEHDKYARRSMKNALRLLKPGGVLIGTAANVGREPHYEFTGVDNHYKNISKAMVLQWFRDYRNVISEDINKYDIQFIVWK